MGLKTYSISLAPHKVILNGQQMSLPTDMGGGILMGLYRKYVNDYPRFFKMDSLSKLGFIASELLINSTGEKRFIDRSDRAILLVSVSGSFETDMRYLQTIINKDNYYPSPSLFVQTLPNIVAGEIAIRNHYHGETACYQLIDDTDLMQTLFNTTRQIPGMTGALFGFLEYQSESQFIANFNLVTQ